MKAPLALLAGILVAATACSRSVCPTTGRIPGTTNSKPGAPSEHVRSAGTYDKNGRLVKRNAYHPSYGTGSR